MALLTPRPLDMDSFPLPDPPSAESAEPVASYAPSVEATEPSLDPTEDAIAAEAYARYLSRGCEDGFDVDDWLEAERALRQR